MRITNACVYINHAFQKTQVRILDGTIVEIGDHLQDADTLDAHGAFLVPGFIDIHTHGGNRVDINHATKASMEKLSRFFAQQGTTSFLSSVMSDTKETTLGLLRTLSPLCATDLGGAQLAGIHLEGPFLSKEYKGAMPEECLLRADPALLENYLTEAKGTVKYITVAPEVEGVIDMIKSFRKDLVFAIGHSGADYDTAMKAIEAGAEAATHTFNAMVLFHMHHPGIVGAVLESDIACEAICDGRHLAPATVRLLLKTKGYGHVVAITDSIMAAGLPDGPYEMGQEHIIVTDGDAQLPNGVRAGSTLTTINALQNLLAFTGRPLEDVLPLLTENPAKLMKLDNKKGTIGVGKDADLLLLDGKHEIILTLVKGKTTYQRSTI